MTGEPEALASLRSGELEFPRHDCVPHHRLIRSVGAGGSSLIFEARDVSGAAAAAKLIVRNPLNRDRWVREADLGSRLRIPGVPFVSSSGVAECGGWFYLLMELLDGVDLRRRIQQEGALSPREVCLIGANLAETCASLHHEGVVHRDITPANIFLTSARGVSLLDLGIAKDLNATNPLTSTGETLGTIAFASPEQIFLSSGVTTAADMYSVGAVFYYALTGQKPHGDGDPGLQAVRAAHADIPPLAGLRPDTPPWLVCLIEKLMSTDPSSRPTAERLAEELRRRS